MPTSKFFSFLSLSLSLLFPLGTHAQFGTTPTNLTTGFVNFANGPKQVTWFYNQNNLVSYEGDIIFGTEEEFNEALINITYTSGSSEPPVVTKRRSDRIDARSNSVHPHSSNLWPGGQVFYRYFDDDTEKRVSSIVEAAKNVWKDAIPCLTFSKVANDNNVHGSNGIVTIRVNEKPLNICQASQIGFHTNSLWMLLDDPGCGLPEVTHEWGHLLGLIHELKRPDAPALDPFICSNVRGYPFGKATTAEADAECCGLPQKCPLPPGDHCCGLACQFTVECGDYNSEDDGPNGGTFDFNSIMLYRKHEFGDGKVTLPNSPEKLPFSPSSEDFNRIRELYGCLPPKCPVGCNPASGANTCSFPTAQDCVFPSPHISNPRAACACRAGFKATAPGISDTDTTKQWRLPADEGNFRVWVTQGVACDTLCDVSTGVDSCKEVVELPADCLHK